MRLLRKPFTLILLALVMLQPIAVSQPLVDIGARNPELEAELKDDVRDRGRTVDATSHTGLKSVRAEVAREEHWEPRGPASPVLARGLYLTGLAGIGFTAHYFFQSLRGLSNYATRRNLLGLTAISFASLYVSFRIELDSSGDSSN